MFNYIIVTLFLILAITEHCLAITKEVIGTAKIKDKVVYVEKHKVEYEIDGKLLKAETRYEQQNGDLIAILKSDFSKSTMVPDHTLQDMRSGGAEGLRREGDKLILFDKPKDKNEETRILEEDDAESRILVGCQGLNYYLLGKLDGTETIQDLPLRFLIPGKLDYYDFDMSEVPSDDKNFAKFEISIKNWFLRIFAPKLYAKYERKTKRLVWYQGLSNIKNDKGENQSVTIDYEYPEII